MRRHVPRREHNIHTKSALSHSVRISKWEQMLMRTSGQGPSSIQQPRPRESVTNNHNTDRIRIVIIHSKWRPPLIAFSILFQPADCHAIVRQRCRTHAKPMREREIGKKKKANWTGNFLAGHFSCRSEHKRSLLAAGWRNCTHGKLATWREKGCGLQFRFCSIAIMWCVSCLIELHFSNSENRKLSHQLNWIKVLYYDGDF